MADTRSGPDKPLWSVLGSLYDQPGGTGDLVGGPSGSLTWPNEELSDSVGEGKVVITVGEDGNTGFDAGCWIEDADTESLAGDTPLPNTRSVWRLWLLSQVSRLSPIVPTCCLGRVPLLRCL